MLKKIVIASGNMGKIKEFNQLLKLWQIQLISQSDLNVPKVKENGCSFIENALLKARNCANYTSLPVIADDSGLCIPFLSGRPGIRSARYSSNHVNNQQNIIKVLDKMNGVSFSDRKAYFFCAIVFLMNLYDAEPIIVTGKLNGFINDEASGKEGFGYDSIFYLPNYNSTLAELKIETKNMMSHRAMAVLSLQQMLLRKYQKEIIA